MPTHATIAISLLGLVLSGLAHAGDSQRRDQPQTDSCADVANLESDPEKGCVLGGKQLGVTACLALLIEHTKCSQVIPGGATYRSKHNDRRRIPIEVLDGEPRPRAPIAEVEAEPGALILTLADFVIYSKSTAACRLVPTNSARESLAEIHRPLKPTAFPFGANAGAKFDPRDGEPHTIWPHAKSSSSADEYILQYAPAHVSTTGLYCAKGRVRQTYSFQLKCHSGYAPHPRRPGWAQVDNVELTAVVIGRSSEPCDSL